MTGETMRSYVRNFPDNRRWGDLETQLKHAAGEVVEAMAARSAHDAAMEILDAMECLEGAMEFIRAESPAIVSRAYRMHLEKQRDRGDYVQG